jgi:hypothetical protein
VSFDRLGLFQKGNMSLLQHVLIHREFCDLDDGLGKKFIG